MTSCAGAKGFANMMLLGTPLDAQSSACAPLMYTMGNAGSISLACWATSQPSIWPRRPMSVTSARYLIKPGYRFLTRSGDSRFKAALGKGLVNDCLNRLVVFNNENYKLVIQRPTPRLPSQKHQSRRQVFVPVKCPKVNLAAFARPPGRNHPDRSGLNRLACG